MAFIPDFAAQIVRSNHVLQCRLGGISRHVSPLCIPVSPAVAATHVRSFDHWKPMQDSVRFVDLIAWKIWLEELQGINRVGQVVPAGLALHAQANRYVENPWAMDQRARSETGRRGS